MSSERIAKAGENRCLSFDTKIINIQTLYLFKALYVYVHIFSTYQKEATEA